MLGEIDNRVIFNSDLGRWYSDALEVADCDFFCNGGESFIVYDLREWGEGFYINLYLLRVSNL